MALTNLTKPRARWTTFKLKVAAAVSRSIFDKLTEGGLSIKDFGATEGEDSTAAIQSAISVAHTLGGGSILIPEGVFNITGIVVEEDYHNIKIIGTSWNSKLVNTATDGSPALHYKSTDRLVHRNYGIYVEGFSLLGNSNSGVGIQVDAAGFYENTSLGLHASTSYIGNMQILQHGADGVKLGKDATSGCGNSLTITNSLIAFNGRTGVVAIGQTNLVNLEASVVCNNAQDGVELNQVASTNSVSRCLLMDNGRYGTYCFRAEQPLLTLSGYNRNASGSIALVGEATGSVKYVEAPLIQGNLFGDNGEVGGFEISVRGVKGGNIKDNYFYYTDSVTRMIYVSDYVEGLTIKGNHWKDLPAGVKKVDYKSGGTNQYVVFDDDVRDDGVQAIELTGKVIRYLLPTYATLFSCRETESGGDLFKLMANGAMLWSDGTNPSDVKVSRTSAGRLDVEAMLGVTQGLLLVTSSGDLSARSDGARVFYDGTDVKVRLPDGTLKKFTLTT